MNFKTLVNLFIVFFISINTNGQKKGYNPKYLPKVLNDTYFVNEKFSDYDKILGFSGHNYSKFDFRDLSLDFLKYQAFDNHTIWPETVMLPEYF